MDNVDTSMCSPRDNQRRSPPIDTRPNIHHFLGAGAPVSSPLTSIPEETEVVDSVWPQARRLRRDHVSQRLNQAVSLVKMVYQLERAHTDSRCREKSQTDQRVWDSHARHHGKNKLATRLLPGVTHPSVGPGQLLLVETEIYGLVSGPIWLRASLTVDLSAAGYVKNPYDKCLFKRRHIGRPSVDRC